MFPLSDNSDTLRTFVSLDTADAEMRTSHKPPADAFPPGREDKTRLVPCNSVSPLLKLLSSALLSAFSLYIFELFCANVRFSKFLTVSATTDKAVSEISLTAVPNMFISSGVLNSVTF